jgi:hypothetical protein
MKPLLVTTAGIELGAGLALLCIPSAASAMVFGAPLTGTSAVWLGRLAGAALLALAIASALASRDVRSKAARGFAAAMTVYNLGAIAVLGAAGITSPPGGLLLWPGVALHLVMTAWCMTCLVRGRT